MRHFLYFIFVGIFLISSCNEEELPQIVPVELKILPHNSNHEFYAGVPVQFGIVETQSSPSVAELDLFVNGNRVEATYLLHSFEEPGTYQVRAVVKMSNSKRYELDTVMNIVTGPPVIGDADRGEVALFGWSVGASYNVMMSSYYGSSVKDYEVLSLDESLEQLGPVKKIDVGWYPDMYDYAASATGNLALLYDDLLKIYDESMTLMHQFSFHYGTAPRKILLNNTHAVLLFDSLSHLTLKTVNLSNGQMVKGPTQFVGVKDMTAFEHFFQNESKIITYYVAPDNSRTLLMGVHVGSHVEFSQYFQPPVFMNNVTPISSGGYVSNRISTEERKLSIYTADASNLVKWSRTFSMNFQNYWFETPGYRITVKELRGFIYVFFDNMRCIKLSADGQLIWDKYFYPAIARFEDVMVTSNGDFIMLGTRLPNPNDNADSQMGTDILCIRINTDGFRVGL